MEKEDNTKENHKKNRLTTIDDCKPMYIYYCIILTSVR